MGKFLMYGHGGCENHGCEAIIRGSVEILNKTFPESSYTLLKQSDEPGIDGQLGLPIDRLLLKNRLSKFSPGYVLAGIQYVLSKSKQVYYRHVYRDFRAFLKNNDIDVSFSVGGDNYCYGMHDSLYYLDKLLAGKCRRVLWGCSVEPDSLKDAGLIADLDSFDLIVAREPITAGALEKSLHKARVIMKPDPAFALKPEKVVLPENLRGRTVVGINLSPMVSNTVDGTDMTFLNYDRAVHHILKNTDYGILLVPHVTWEKSNDLKPLRALYEKYRDTGRVALIEEFQTCEELKGYIGQCDMFIGARTHSTIAAYSSCVPCVVVGYSVKAEGIATQLFGTTENYVIRSQTMESEDILISAFQWLNENQHQIKDRLTQIMPGYIAEAYSAAEAVMDLL